MASRFIEKGSRETGDSSPVSKEAMQSPSSGPNLKARPLPPANTATFG